MGELVYILCALTSLACAILLVRSYLASRTRLLWWSSVCFIGLFVNNSILVTDLMLTTSDLLFLRDITNLASVAALIFGLIWDARG
jgi:hypothetical protein